MTLITTSTTVETLSEILGDTTSILTGLFEQMEWAEDEINQAIRRHPNESDILFHSFLLLKPTHHLMGTEFVYRSHCRELLERAVTGTDTRPGTAAETCCALRDCSLLAPLSSPAAGLYFRMWAHAFPEQPNPGRDRRQHHEALEGATIDDLEATTRHKLTVEDRTLGTIDCPGRHHGQPVQCRYLNLDHTGVTPAQQLPLPDAA